MMTLIASFLALIGAAFVLLAAVGMWRFPDVFCRMHASAKAGSFGVVWLGLAVAILLPSTETFIRVALIIASIYLTAPVACHLIGRLARGKKSGEAGRDL